MITTSTQIHGKSIKKTHGFVEGSATRTKHIGNDIIAGLKGILGGEVSEYTKLMEEARQQAVQRLEDAAERMGANAVVDVRITTSAIAAGVSEILIYGTAVTVE